MARNVKDFEADQLPPLAEDESTIDPGVDRALAELASRSVPQPGPSQSKQRLADAHAQQADLQLAAGLGHGIGKIIQGISGGSQAAAPSAQEYQARVSGSYAPVKQAERMRMVEADDLEITKKRQALEMADPTSDANREFQKRMAPTFERLGIEDLAPYMTVADAMNPGGLLHAAKNAENRRAEKERSAKIQLAQSDLRFQHQQELQAQRDTAAMERAQLKKKSRGSGVGGGGGSSSVSARKAALKAAKQERLGRPLTEAEAETIDTMTTKELKEARGVENRAATRQGEKLDRGEIQKASKLYLKEKKQIESVITPAKFILKAFKNLPPAKIRQALFLKKFPDSTIPEDVAVLRSAIQKMLAFQVKDISGGAVSASEFDRLQEAYGTGMLSNPAVLLSGVKDILKVGQGYIEDSYAVLLPEVKDHLRSSLGGQSKGGKVKVRRVSDGVTKLLDANTAKKLQATGNYEVL